MTLPPPADLAGQLRFSFFSCSVRFVLQSVLVGQSVSAPQQYMPHSRSVGSNPTGGSRFRWRQLKCTVTVYVPEISEEFVVVE